MLDPLVSDYKSLKLGKFSLACGTASSNIVGAMKGHLKSTSPIAIFTVLLVSVLLACHSTADAQTDTRQVPAPDREHLFTEDTKEQKKLEKAEEKTVLKQDPTAGSDQVDFKANSVEVLKDSKDVKGVGGVLVSGDGVQIQADQAQFNTETKDTKMEGNIVITGQEGVLSGERGDFNLDTETGELADGSVTFEEGAYELNGKRVLKESEFGYKLFDSNMTTCHCSKGDAPWQILCDEAHITQEGYAHTYNTTMEMYGVPFFYTPYLAFPVKQKRASGLLVPEYGYSSRDGFKFNLPVFMVIDDSTDATITPFIESRTRVGSEFDYRQSFSQYHNLSGRMIYSNESNRDGDLRGTDVSALTDPTIDTDRFGGFYRQLWRSKSEAEVPFNFIADLHYVSDDLFLREIEDKQIGERQSRYATSKTLLSTTIGDYVSTEVSGEYNQAIETDDDVTFQRLPEFGVSAIRSFRPFGFNPYGIKIISRNQLSATEFVRDDGYDGWRTDLNPGLRIPFHVQNYVTSEINLGVHQTNYSMHSENMPGASTATAFDEERTAFNVSYAMQSALERVYDIDSDSWLSWMTALGSKNQDERLKRVKHVIEPLFRYTYIPDTTQDDLPLYDSLDRIREKSLFTYGLRTSLYGRFLPPTGTSTDQIPELTPRVQDLPLFGMGTSLSDFGSDETVGSGNVLSMRRGSIKELVQLNLRQSYDYKEDHEDNDASRSAFSDVYGDVTFFPTNSFGFRYETNYDAEEHNVSSWAIATQLRDDRGDALTARFNYVENALSQIDGNAEIAFHDRLRAGYYTRFDDRESEFIENTFAFRFLSECDCWYIDLGMTDRINPDKKAFLLSFTFFGLGDISQKVSVGEKRGH